MTYHILYCRVFQEIEQVASHNIKHHYIETDDPHFVYLLVRMDTSSIPSADVNEGDQRLGYQQNDIQEVSSVGQQDYVRPHVVYPYAVVLEYHSCHIVDLEQILDYGQTSDSLDLFFVFSVLDECLLSDLLVQLLVPASAEVNQDEVENHQATNAFRIAIFLDGDHTTHGQKLDIVFSQVQVVVAYLFDH